MNTLRLSHIDVKVIVGERGWFVAIFKDKQDSIIRSSSSPFLLLQFFTVSGIFVIGFCLFFYSRKNSNHKTTFLPGLRMVEGFGRNSRRGRQTQL